MQGALGRPIHENIFYRDLPEEIQKELWGRFFAALQPLHAAGKLRAIHFQSRPGFRYAPWWNERNRDSTLAFEREHGLVDVVVDGPQVGNSVSAVWEVTSPKLAIVRMHGRNRETRNKKGLKAASDRFN